MSVLITPECAVKQLKNLGWLVRHWQEVKSFEVTPYGHCCILMGNVYGQRKMTPPIEELRAHDDDCILIARLKDGGAYVAAFGDIGVLLNWLHRPVFFSLKVNWFGVEITLEQNSAIHKKARGG